MSMQAPYLTFATVATIFILLLLVLGSFHDFTFHTHMLLTNYTLCTSLYYTTHIYPILHFTPVHYTTHIYTTLHFITLQYTTHTYQMVKNLRVWTLQLRRDFLILHYTILHYTTLSPITINMNCTTLYYECTALQYAVLHYTVLCFIVLSNVLYS
jgi:hypothetical protein